MKIKKIASLFIVFVLLLSIFGGCKQETNETSTSASTSESTSEGSSTTETPPASEEVVRFSIAAARPDNQPPVKEVEIIQNLVANSNVEIDWIDWQESAKQEKISLAFASGDYPDVLYGAWILNMGQVVNYASQGMLLELDSYLTEEITPNLHRIYDMRPDYKSSLVIPDGHIYSIASVDESSTHLINDTYVINTEWLETVGKEKPTTTDELYDVLKAFKDAGDLNGNGEDDEIPMLALYGNHMRGVNSLFGAWGTPLNHGLSLNIIDGKVTHIQTQPEFKEGVAYLHKLYSEGLLDQEIFTIDNASLMAKTNAETPVVGFMLNWNRAAMNEAAGREVYDYVAPIRASNDVEPVWQSRNMPANGCISIAITNKAENPAGILNFMDKLYEPEFSIQNTMGTFDKFIDNHGDGTYDLILNAEGKPPTPEELFPFVQTKRGGWMILRDDFAWGTQTPAMKEDALTSEIYNSYVNTKAYPNVWLTLDESEQESILYNDIHTHIKTTVAHWISEGGIEEEWDAYLGHLEGLGMEEFIQIRQIVYDRYMENA